jgi:hypothetical protein
MNRNNTYLCEKKDGSLGLTANTYAEDTLGHCKFCLSKEMTYDQHVDDASCGNCGAWQNEAVTPVFGLKDQIDVINVVNRKASSWEKHRFIGAVASPSYDGAILLALKNGGEILADPAAFESISERMIETMNDPLSVFRSNAGTWMIKPVPGQVMADVCGSGYDSADYANAVLLASSRTLLEALKLIANEGRDDAAVWMRGVARAAITEATDVSGYQERKEDPSEVVIGFDPNDPVDIDEKIKLLEQYRWFKQK